jgi:hypothetical protein
MCTIVVAPDVTTIYPIIPRIVRSITYGVLTIPTYFVFIDSIIGTIPIQEDSDFCVIINRVVNNEGMSRGNEVDAKPGIVVTGVVGNCVEIRITEFDAFVVVVAGVVRHCVGI